MEKLVWNEYPRNSQTIVLFLWSTGLARCGRQSGAAVQLSGSNAILLVKER